MSLYVTDTFAAPFPPPPPESSPNWSRTSAPRTNSTPKQSLPSRQATVMRLRPALGCTAHISWLPAFLSPDLNSLPRREHKNPLSLLCLVRALCLLKNNFPIAFYLCACVEPTLKRSQSQRKRHRHTLAATTTQLVRTHTARNSNHPTLQAPRFVPPLQLCFVLTESQTPFWNPPSGTKLKCLRKLECAFLVKCTQYSLKQLNKFTILTMGDFQTGIRRFI